MLLAIIDMPARLERIEALVIEEIRRREEEGKRLSDQIADVGRNMSAQWVTIQEAIETQAQIVTVGGQNDQGEGGSTTQRANLSAQSLSTSGPKRKPNVKITGRFSAELRRRMGMEENQLLPDYTPEEQRPRLNGQPVLRINWDLPWNGPENRDMVRSILQSLTADPNGDYTRRVFLNGGIDTALKLCLDSVHNLYYERRKQQKKGESVVREAKAKKRREMRAVKKQQKRQEELELEGNSDLLNRYDRMRWNLVAATSEDETDEERSRAEGSTKYRLVLPSWRSLQHEEIVREADERRKVRLMGTGSLARDVYHPQRAFFPPQGEQPKPLPSTIWRWMVSRVWAKRYPQAWRNVKYNLPTERTPDADGWGDPPPYVVREPIAGALVGGESEQGRARTGRGGGVEGAGRAPDSRGEGSSASMPQRAEQENETDEQSDIHPDLRRAPGGASQG